MGGDDVVSMMIRDYANTSPLNLLRARAMETGWMELCRWSAATGPLRVQQRRDDHEVVGEDGGPHE